MFCRRLADMEGMLSWTWRFKWCISGSSYSSLRLLKVETSLSSSNLIRPSEHSLSLLTHEGCSGSLNSGSGMV